MKFEKIIIKTTSRRLCASSGHMVAGTGARHLLSLVVGLGCVVAVVARSAVAASIGLAGDGEPTHARMLRLASTAAAAALVAQILLYRRSGTGSREGDRVKDPEMTWQEDYGVSKVVPLRPAVRPALRDKPLPRFTVAEVAKHNTREDCWIIIDERAYDITSFISRHPGGIGPITNLAGKDVTDVFANYHAARVYKTMLPAFLVGEVTDVELHPHVRDFREVRQELLRRGLFETDYRFYGKLGAWFALLFVFSLYLSLGCESRTARLAGAATMGLFWQQLAGIGHDLGHSGVTHNFHVDHIIGSLLSGLMGLSVCWWKSNHNTHHVVCNAVEHDPDIQHMPILAVTPKIFDAPGPWWDTYHSKWVGMDWFAKLLVSNQHFFFYPVMAVARFNLYLQGIIFLAGKRDTIHYRKLEAVAIGFFFAWLGALLYAQPTALDAALWALVSHGVGGLLHVQIVLSHWSMDTYHGHAYNTADDEWYKMQLKTTMNVATHPWLDWVHIGLQFQIEHHLFPRLPRHNLRFAREMVRKVCSKHGIKYHEPGFFAGNLEMWRALKKTAMAARDAKRTESGFYQSKIWDGLNLTG